MSREKLLLNGTECISMKSKRRNLNSATKLNKEPNLSRTHAPADLSPLDWQRGLRRQFGREQAFGLENLSSEPFFSEFRISNPVSKSSYRVAIRGLGQVAISVHAPIMPPASWVPASTSNSRLPGWKKARRQDGVCAGLPACIF